MHQLIKCLIMLRNRVAQMQMLLVCPHLCDVSPGCPAPMLFHMRVMSIRSFKSTFAFVASLIVIQGIACPLSVSLAFYAALLVCAFCCWLHIVLIYAPS